MMSVIEMTMLCGKICKDIYANARIMGRLRVTNIEYKTCKRRLVWYDHVIRRLSAMRIKKYLNMHIRADCSLREGH